VLDCPLGDDKQDEDVSILDEVKCKEDPLCWWKMNGSHFSHLELLARMYLTIPATSTPSERVFSVAGIVVDKRRSALTPEMIDALVFLIKQE